MKIKIKETKRVFDSFFKIDRAVIQHEKFDGTMSDEIVRLNFNRGSAVAVLVVNPVKNSVIFTKQFRYPAYIADQKDGWLLEIAAGIVESDLGVEETAKKEVFEELGYKVDKIELINYFYPSPGGSSEKIYLYYAEVVDRYKVNDGGGLDSEGEDIQIVELPINEAIQMLDEGKIIDAKTIIALQWLKLR